MKKSIAVVGGLTIGVVVLVAVFIWPTSLRPAIIGTWELENVVGENIVGGSGGSVAGRSRFEFYSDGRGRVDGTPFTWTSERDLLRITSNGETVLFEYRIAGSTLTFTYGKIYLILRKVR